MRRKATEADISKIRQLMQSEPGFWSDGWPPAALETALRAANGLSLVWEEKGEIVGFICAHDLGFRGYLSELIVHKESRGKDIGTMLLRGITEELSARGCPVLISDVWRNAEGFYRNFGWNRPEVILLIKRLGEPVNLGRHR